MDMNILPQRRRSIGHAHPGRVGLGALVLLALSSAVAGCLEETDEADTQAERAYLLLTTI